MSNPLNLGTKLMIDSIREFGIENNLGKFKYEGNGRLLVQPNKGVEYLVLNIEILPTGEAN